MSRHGEVTLPFGGEDRVFRLGLGQVRAIQEKCDAGLPELISRLSPMLRVARVPEAERGQVMLQAMMAGQLGSWRVDDYREVIYQGLLGGDAQLGATMATLMVQKHVDDRPPLESCLTALQVLRAAMVGVEDEPLGEKPGPAPPKPKTRRRRSRAASSASPTSTAAAP